MKPSEKLAKILSERFGISVSADDLIPATGYWRISHQVDVYRWEGRYIDENGIGRFIASYQTMTELCKCKFFRMMHNGEIIGEI